VLGVCVGVGGLRVCVDRVLGLDLDSLVCGEKGVGGPLWIVVGDGR
jgi:hypothetical protein